MKGFEEDIENQDEKGGGCGALDDENAASNSKINAVCRLLCKRQEQFASAIAADPAGW